MSKVLRVLVFVILVLSVVSLTFAIKLFEKRELLMKRNSVLEETVIRLSKTIEAADAEEAAAPVVQKDISDVTDRELANPERESVLASYPVKLEEQNLPSLDFGSTDKRLQLRSYFVVDETGQYVLDPVDNKPATKGPGSMQELSDTLFERAKTQQATLNTTRAQLAKMREQFTSSIEEINKLKVEGRTSKVELKSANEKVVTLTGEKTQLEGRVTQLTAEKRELSAELADSKNEVEKLNENAVILQEDLAKVRQAFEEMKERYAGKRTPATTAQSGQTEVTALTAGDKGQIIEVNDDLKFVIIDFSNNTMEEMLGSERQNQLPQLEMNIRRPGRQSATGEFVTRVKLRQAVRGKNLVVADILYDWQQSPVEKGDVVFF